MSTPETPRTVGELESRVHSNKDMTMSIAIGETIRKLINTQTIDRTTELSDEIISLIQNTLGATQEPGSPASMVALLNLLATSRAKIGSENHLDAAHDYLESFKASPSSERAQEGFISPAHIYQQEAHGQREVVTSSKLPIKGLLEHREQLERMGFVFEEQANDLFWNVKLPKGWKKDATDHSMWSSLVDETGKKRASIFYKAAFYDKRANINWDGPLE